VVGNVRNSKILVNWLVTSVPWFTGSNAKTLGLKHLQFPDMRAGGELPDRAHVVHHRTDELHVQQNSIADGETTSPVKRIPNTPSLCTAFILNRSICVDWVSRVRRINLR
jgi:hypothetical protein